MYFIHLDVNLRLRLTLEQNLSQDTSGHISMHLSPSPPVFAFPSHVPSISLPPLSLSWQIDRNDLGAHFNFLPYNSYNHLPILIVDAMLRVWHAASCPALHIDNAVHWMWA